MSQESNNNRPRRSNDSGSRRVASTTPRAGGEEGDSRQSTRPRKRRRKGAGPLGAMLYVMIVVGVSILLACLGWNWAGDVLALNKESHSAVIEVREGDSLNDITNSLKENGLIEYKFVFKLFAALTKTSVGAEAEDDITPGSYELTTDMDYRALISSMGSRSGNRTVATITITEGMNVNQIFSMLEEQGVTTVERLRETAANYDFGFSFLKGVIPLGDHLRLEGYLFPDTYDFYKGEDPITILNKMILRFDQVFTDEMRQQASNLGYTIHDIVVIASMIEKETDGEDQSRIASVIYNRLDNPRYETAGFLQIDATIAYVTGRVVTLEDYQGVDSPFNTYRNKGLPPAPISNPGSVAIHAALNPADEGYFYYALGDDKVHHFFKTKAELDRFLNS